MEKVSDCTPLSDINCKNESAASSTGKTPAAEETVTTILGMLASPFLYLIIIVVLAVVVVCILCRKKFMSYLKGICSGRCWLRVGALGTFCPAPSHSVPTDSNPHPCPWSKRLQPGSIFLLVIAPSPRPVYPQGPWSHQSLSQGWGTPHLPEPTPGGQASSSHLQTQPGRGQSALQLGDKGQDEKWSWDLFSLGQSRTQRFSTCWFLLQFPFSSPFLRVSPNCKAPFLSPAPGLLVQCPSPQPSPAPHCPLGGRCCMGPSPPAQETPSFPGGGGGPERVHRVLFRQRSCPSQVPGAEDKAHNETLSNRYLQPTQISEQEIQGQELAEPTGVTVESPEEPQRLLEQAEAEGCQRRRLLVPVNDADSADISTLLDASATLEEGHAKETIQDQLVGSEKLFYEEDEAGFAASCL
ncbi:tumor necrosis factor receptor superfamily member 10D isoform X2 [Pan troglodytes]|uniref:tumor necrosis factor receptor superfamily member 10D isoform X2 n=1 Tax=Pan troglodytes TaxID=9598 RepID=UPI003013758A